MYVEEVAFNIILRLHSTAYSRTKNFTTNTFLELLKKKKTFKNFSNFKKKTLQNRLFSLRLQVCS